MKKRRFYLWVDTETTDLTYNKIGKPNNIELMEIAAILTDDELHIIDKYKGILKLSQSILDKMNDFAKTTDLNNNLIAEMKHSNLTVDQAQKDILNIINKNTKKKDLIFLAGNNIHCDLSIIRKFMPELYSKLYYRVLDVSSIKELLYNVDKQIVKDAEHKKLYTHRAYQDICESLEEYKDYKITFLDVVSSYQL